MYAACSDEPMAKARPAQHRPPIGNPDEQDYACEKDDRETEPRCRVKPVMKSAEALVDGPAARRGPQPERDAVVDRAGRQPSR